MLFFVINGNINNGYIIIYSILYSTYASNYEISFSKFK